MNKVRPWRVVDLAILITHNSTPVPAVVSPLPPEALEIAQEATIYLEGPCGPLRRRGGPVQGLEASPCPRGP